MVIVKLDPSADCQCSIKPAVQRDTSTLHTLGYLVDGRSPISGVRRALPRRSRVSGEGGSTQKHPGIIRAQFLQFGAKL